MLVRIPFHTLTLLDVVAMKENPKQGPLVERRWTNLISMALGPIWEKAFRKQKDQILRLVYMRTYPRGTILAEEGKILNEKQVLFVVKGKLRFFKRDKHWKRPLLKQFDIVRVDQPTNASVYAP